MFSPLGLSWLCIMKKQLGGTLTVICTVLTISSSPHQCDCLEAGDQSFFFHFHSFDYQYQWVIHPNLVTHSDAVGGGGWRFRLPRLESGFNLTLPSMTKASEICETPKKAPTVVIVAYRVKELFSPSDQRTSRVELKTLRWVRNTPTCKKHITRY